ncbi:MAG: hypothetical protein DWI59_05120 [Chloroflexi bacterium]|nr:MAG: hypothetical protein DWI59_05120 [Chloroflexota bacterium]
MYVARSRWLFSVLIMVAVAGLLIGSRHPSIAGAAALSATYEGSMSDGGTVQLTTNADATKVDIAFAFKNPPAGCPASALLTAVTIDPTGYGFRVDRQVGAAGTVSVAGFWDSPSYYAVSGAMSLDPGTAQSGCPARRASFRAGLSSGGIPFGIGRGTMFSGAGVLYVPGSIDPVGTVKMATNDGGTGLSSFTFDYKQGSCTYAGTLGRPVSYDAGPTLESKEGAAQSWTLAASSIVDAINGGIAVDGLGSCPKVALVFSAGPGATSPLPTQSIATPAPTASVTSTPAAGAGVGKLSGPFPASGVGLAVFSGGTTDQMVAAANCPRTTAAYFASDGAGGFATYVPGVTIAAVNAAWMALLPTSIPASTVIIGRCS